MSRALWCLMGLTLLGASVASAQELDAGLVDAGEPEVVAPDAGEPLPLTDVLDAGSPYDAPVLDAGLLALDDVPDAGPSRETVVVGTPEWRTAGSAHTINGARLKRYELDDPHAVLQAVPGVQVRGEDGFGLRPNIGLRGANPDRSKKVTLMEDGVLLGPAPYSAPAAYYFPLMTRMETVRVVKGPGAIMYGPQTVGGAIDFVTRDFGPGVSAGLDAALGQYWYGKAHGYFSAANDTSGFLIEGVHLRSDGFKVLDTVGGNTGFQRNEWMVKGRHRIDVGQYHHHFNLKLGFSSEQSNETYLGLSDADFRAAPLRRYVASEFDQMNWHRTQLNLSHKLEAPGWSLTTTAYRHDFHRIWRKANHFRGAAFADVLAAPTSARNAVFMAVLRGEADSSSDAETLLIGPNQRDFVAQGVESVFRTEFTTGPLQHAFEARARYHFDSIARLHTEDAFVMRSGRPVSAGEPTSVLVHNYEATHAVALSVNDAITWGRVTLTPGVRVELINSRSSNFLAGTTAWGTANVVLPGVGAYVAATENLGVFAGAYRGFSPPAPGQPSSVLPEYALNAEAGARWTRKGERLEVIGFFNDYANLTDICTFSNGCLNESLDRQFSLGEANIYGLEVYGEKRLKAGIVTIPLAATYTFTGTRLLSSFSSDDPVFGAVREGDELPYVPKHLFNASVGVDVWRVSAHAQVTFIDRMRELAGQGAFIEGRTTDAQLTVDLHLGFKVTEWAGLYFDARNLFDQHAIVGRLPFGARPNAPRTLIGGVKLTY
jgi:Fe(3+) dicitrate transport protein